MVKQRKIKPEAGYLGSPGGIAIYRRMKSIRIFAPPFNVTHELRGGDGDVPDLAPSHEYRVDGAVRLPEVHLEGVRRGREEALVGRVKR